MNIKRILTWLGFVIIIALIVVGLVVSSEKRPSTSETAIPLPTPITSTDWIRGNPNAKVTIVEYGDFQCPACQAYYPVVEQVFDASSSTIRMIFREFPLPQHADALPAAKAAEAAGDQGKFWNMFDLLYQNGNDWDNLSDPTSVFDGYAKQLDLNLTRFDADMNSTTTAQKIADSVTVGTAAGIDATPTFFINGYRIENPESYDEFITAIQTAASSTAP
jgi:protein-disulfide isomerase